MDTPKLPERLYRVVFYEGFGWPKCTRQELTQRTYSSAQNAGRMVHTIEALPSHHRLVGVYATDCFWEPCDERDMAGHAHDEASGHYADSAQDEAMS